MTWAFYQYGPLVANGSAITHPILVDQVEVVAGGAQRHSQRARQEAAARCDDEVTNG
jgi:hypothetical protein